RGDDAEELARSGEHGNGEEVVRLGDLGDALGGVVGADRHRVAPHDLREAGGGVKEEEVADRDHALQAGPGVDQVDVVDELDLAGEPAQPLERLGGGQVGRQGDELGGHHAARGVWLVPQELLDVRG